MRSPGKNVFNAQRRKLLQALLAVPAAAFISTVPGLAFSADAAVANKRFVLIILRGAMDGLAAVTPYGDSALKSLRGSLLPAESELHKLDSYFGLHPAFSNLATLYQRKELLICHAVASPYRERSHFDAQNVLESGLLLPDPSASGWLNRCVPALSGNNAAMAIGQAIPPVLQGAADVASWSPAVLPGPSDDTLQRIQQLYEQDPFLSSRLTQALMAGEMAGSAAMAGNRARGQNFTVLVEAAANFMAQESGPSIAVLESNGWDTHANQGGTQGQLARKFTELDTGLAQLQKGMGDYWNNTVVAVVTEFGRTVSVNGTQGTDHGTGSVAFLVGGAVQGGRMLGEWPGLANLHEGRDLRPTTDLRSLFKSVLRDHLGVSQSTLDTAVFPDSSAALYINGLT